MPDDLFYPVGVVSCVMIFQAGQPHDSYLKTRFGYCKDDGFEKDKKEGRIDKKHKREAIQEKRLEGYFNYEEIP